MPGSSPPFNLAPPLSSHGSNPAAETNETVTYYGVCLTVWSHADGERSAAIRRALESANGANLGHRGRKESVHSLITKRLKHLRDGTVDESALQRRSKRSGTRRTPWNGAAGATDIDTDAETEMVDAGGASESEFEVASTIGHGPGESTLFLPGDTIFWLPYALSKQLCPLRYCRD